jgi:D-aminoacyl-tRNA deacylase
MGGKAGKVCLTSAYLLKYLFQELDKNARKEGLDKKYNITLEVTHHGPLIEMPCCFIEIGSKKEQWLDKQAARAIAKTILSLQNFYSADCSLWIPAIGIGGPHYCPNFNKVQLSSIYAISHIIPQYNLPLTESMIKEAEQKTNEQVKIALLDWKGLGKSEDRQKILKVLKNYGLDYKRTSYVEK